MQLPPIGAFMGPLLRVLATLGGRATNAELEHGVAEAMGLTQDQLRALHTGRGSRTEFAYRLAWTRTKLKAEGAVEAAGRGVWKITEAGRSRISAS